MTSSVKTFDDLVAIIDRLLADDGCPWDREQTVLSLSHMLLEEVCETIDSVRDDNAEHLADELGDLFVTALFFAKAAQKEGRFLWEAPFKKGIEKLVRRHPHIFDQAALLTSDQVKEQWETLKKKEPAHQHRKHRVDGIPSSLPGLAMMQKFFVKIGKHPDLKKIVEGCMDTAQQEKDPEKVLGSQIAALVFQAQEKGIQAEQALRLFYATCKEAVLDTSV